MMLETAFGFMLYVSYPSYVTSHSKKQMTEVWSTHPFACKKLHAWYFKHAAKVTNCEARIDNIN